ncbi:MULTISPECIES: hypothetical protein [Prochlorococcus]|uniref:hypothetical protein n=1 Tax=Prochlorococcus TaxID=1218 RepID=UPI000533A2B0|nr:MULTISPECIES: hypothetical protein [Prochlorococcus]KGG12148.1 hypothetical protein EV05_1352 [Prochlorococcus sp. MIT 0601]
MELLVKAFERLGEENKLLLKKALFAGVILYVLLLAIHDLLPYALAAGGCFYLYRWLSKNNTT